MELVLERVRPELKIHLSRLGVSPSMFLPPWLLTVFAADFPLSFSGRLLDIMHTEGWRRILINTAASLLTVATESLLAAETMEAALNVLKVSLGFLIFILIFITYFEAVLKRIASWTPSRECTTHVC
jgi:hypothetical protein